MGSMALSTAQLDGWVICIHARPGGSPRMCFTQRWTFPLHEQAQSFKLINDSAHQSLTPLTERDTLIKFGAATRVSQFQGLQGRQV